MRIITLEDHFTTPMALDLLPPDTPARRHHREEMNKRLGFDSEAELLDIFGDVPSVDLPRAQLDGEGLPIADLLVVATAAKSKGEARRLLAG